MKSHIRDKTSGGLGLSGESEKWVFVKKWEGWGQWLLCLLKNKGVRTALRPNIPENLSRLPNRYCVVRGRKML